MNLSGILIVILSIFLCMYVQLVQQMLVQQMQINLCPNMYFGGLTKLLISHLQVAPLFDSVHICVECWINFRQNCYHNQDLQSKYFHTKLQFSGRKLKIYHIAVSYYQQKW